MTSPISALGARPLMPPRPMPPSSGSARIRFGSHALTFSANKDAVVQRALGRLGNETAWQSDPMALHGLLKTMVMVSNFNAELGSKLVQGFTQAFPDVRLADYEEMRDPANSRARRLDLSLADVVSEEAQQNAVYRPYGSEGYVHNLRRLAFQFFGPQGGTTPSAGHGELLNLALDMSSLCQALQTQNAQILGTKGAELVPGGVNGENRLHQANYAHKDAQ